MISDNLLENLKKGDTDAFRLLVEKYKDKIINICYRFVLNHEDAEDIAQDVFVGVYKSISGFREQSGLSTWMYRIAVSKSLDFLRRKKRQKRKIESGPVFDLEKHRDSVPGPDQLIPDTDLENRERVNILHAAINTLPKNQRIAISLSTYDNLGNKEAADIMGISVSAMEALIHRGKLNLRKKLYKYYKNIL